MKREHLPKYCKGCGTLLKVLDKGSVNNGYDEQTGKEKRGTRLYIVCPNDDSAISELHTSHTNLSMIVEE